MCFAQRTRDDLRAGIVIDDISNNLNDYYTFLDFMFETVQSVLRCKIYDERESQLYIWKMLKLYVLAKLTLRSGDKKLSPLNALNQLTGR